MSIDNHWQERINVRVHLPDGAWRPGYIIGEATNPQTGIKCYVVRFTDTPLIEFTATINNVNIGFDTGTFYREQLEVVNE